MGILFTQNQGAFDARHVDKIVGLYFKSGAQLSHTWQRIMVEYTDKETTRMHQTTEGFFFSCRNLLIKTSQTTQMLCIPQHKHRRVESNRKTNDVKPRVDCLKPFEFEQEVL